MLNFIAGGMMGDFIHSLYAVKMLCEQKQEKANLFISNSGDVWRFGLEKTYDDLYELITNQAYINKFKILSHHTNSQDFINLNDWRILVAETHRQHGIYKASWSQVLSETYKFSITSNYKWLNINKIDNITNNKITIHRSIHRHNGSFPWKQILDQIHEEILFITSSLDEWNVFPHKTNNIKLYHVNTISDMATAINSCKMFIGNQSAPFAISCALDKPRLVELDYDPAPFYMEENKYSQNISWFLNNETKFISPVSSVII